MLIAVVLLLTIASSFGAYRTAQQMQRLMDSIVSRNLPSVETAAELQKTLLQQKGLVATFMLDEGRLAWVNDLDLIKPKFAQRLAEAKRTARSDEERNILNQLAQVYEFYDQERERAIALYVGGHVAEAKTSLLGDVSRLSDQASDLCRELVAANERNMASSLQQTHQRMIVLGFALACGAGLAIVLSAGLLLIVFRRVLLPVRKLTRDARAFSDGPSSLPRPRFTDEFHELEFYSRALMSDVSRTRMSLEESASRLGMAEKLAAVGKFAACAAHEIRSPLTSMRMWLYELRRNSRNPSEVEQHCKVLEAEVGRLEELATSFLHFSRPPSLRLAPQDVHSIIDCTLELARHRLEAKGLRVVRVNGSVLPLIMADENQLRQVVLNLISNAADAAPERGEIRIIETTESDPEGHPAVVVRVQDTGPGVSKDVREHLFEPFVTTKPNGTGLGLCVSSSIVVQHGGRLALEPGEGPGATFAIYLPACGD